MQCVAYARHESHKCNTPHATHMQHTATHCANDAVCCSVLQCVAVYCSVLQCIAVCCSVLQCVAVCCCTVSCGVLHAAAQRGMRATHSYVCVNNALQCTPRLLQYNAGDSLICVQTTHCNTHSNFRITVRATRSYVCVHNG